MNEPNRPYGQARDEWLQIRVSRPEKALLRAMAKDEGQTMSDFVRGFITDAARRRFRGVLATAGDPEREKVKA